MFHPLAQSESGNKKTALKRSSETQSRRKLFVSLMFFVIVRCQHLLFYLPDIAILADDQPRVKAARAAELWKTPPRKIRANFQSPASGFQTNKTGIDCFCRGAALCPPALNLAKQIQRRQKNGQSPRLMFNVGCLGFSLQSLHKIFSCLSTWRCVAICSAR